MRRPYLLLAALAAAGAVWRGAGVPAAADPIDDLAGRYALDVKLDPPLGRCVKIGPELIRTLHDASEFACDMRDNASEIDGKTVHSALCWRTHPPNVDYQIYPTMAQCRLGRAQSDH